MRLDLTPAAREDLADLHAFGWERWGKDRADRYLDTIIERLNDLRARRIIGTSADEVDSGLRRLVVGSHVVFFRLGEERLRIVRVLHQSRDVTRWLGD